MKTDADVEHVCVDALSDKQIDDPMRITPPEDERTRYGSHDNIILTVFEREFKSLIADEPDRIHAERTQAKVRNGSEIALVDMFQIGNSATSNGVKTASSWFLGTNVIELLIDGSADDVMSNCFQRK